MALPTRPCAVNKCRTSSCAICHCCRTDLCLDHLKEHKDQLNAKLIPLADQINTFLDSLEHFNPTSSPTFIQLEQWRNSAHATVDLFYQNLHRQLLDQINSRPRQELREARYSLDELIRNQGATRENIDSLTNDLRVIEERINSLQRTPIQLRPLAIDDKTFVQHNTSSDMQQHPHTDQATAVIAQTDLQALQNGSAFQIFVQLHTGKQIIIPVKPSDTILDVKGKIQTRSNWPVEQQRVTYMGKHLQDDYNIAAYGIAKHGTLHATLVFQSKPAQSES